MRKILLFSLMLTTASAIGLASLNFDGVDDYVATPVVTDNTTFASWTLEAWVKSPNSPANTGGTGPVYGQNMGIVWNHTQSAYRGGCICFAIQQCLCLCKFWLPFR